MAQVRVDKRVFGEIIDYLVNTRWKWHKTEKIASYTSYTHAVIEQACEQLASREFLLQKRDKFAFNYKHPEIKPILKFAKKTKQKKKIPDMLVNFFMSPSTSTLPKGLEVTVPDEPIPEPPEEEPEEEIAEEVEESEEEPEEITEEEEIKEKLEQEAAEEEISEEELEEELEEPEEESEQEDEPEEDKPKRFLGIWQQKEAPTQEPEDDLKPTPTWKRRITSGKEAIETQLKKRGVLGVSEEIEDIKQEFELFKHKHPRKYYKQSLKHFHETLKPYEILELPKRHKRKIAAEFIRQFVQRRT